MKRFLIAVALTGVISANTLAGNVPTGDFVPPPPSPPASATIDPEVARTELAVALTDMLLLTITTW